MTTTLTARGPEDLLAAVPVVLGFHPQDSLVMLTFGAEHTFHARLDLPPPETADEEEWAEITEALLGPSRAHGVQQVAFVVYSGDGGSAARLAAELVPAFVAEGFGVVDVIRAHEGHWTRVPIRAGAEESPPVPFDDTHHPFVAQAVFDGRVTLASREEVRASLARSPELEARWAAVMAQLPRERRDEAERVQELLARWVGGEEPDDEGAARVLRLVSRVEVRDAVVYAVTRDNARDHLRVWSALLRGAPDPQVPDTAAVTAFCAWLTGHGALAWCALDRCFEIDPDHRLGSCLAECLTRAVPPSVWEELDRGIRRSSPRRESA